MKSTNQSILLLLTLLTTLTWTSNTTAQEFLQVVESDTHRFEEVAEGVWLGTGTGSVYTMSNVMVLVGEFDTLVVDSHVTPAAARALLESLTLITDKPVRYLINSHYHFDHAHGNQAFPEGVEIIGHEFTRAKLNGDLGNVLEENTFRSFSDSVPNTVATLAEQARTETDPERKATLQQRHQVQQDYLNAIPEVDPTPPNITLNRNMTLFQIVANGSREIQLHHFGRAHTGGDVVVFLPHERIVFTGDMMLPRLAYMGDGHVNEWPEALEQLKALEFDTLLPGHGTVMRDLSIITHFQAYLRDLWNKTSAMHEQGVSADDAAERIDMTNHRVNFPQIEEPGVDPRAVRRIYQLLP
ncbi:MAG: MBL fold metallo-hydrolase [Pseudohongiellaceae bacterium]